ncbi:MAG: molecular chaperone HtpG [Oscillospiraceae bacterium]|nr:molecular chaperone HtpG [Oscillospiraceae bacterium]MBQ9250864.1 molecular chaperone HtpG [Oscillospiraceae bacterium]
MAKKQFKAESKRLLDLMINSIYTNKEIFLREIISNASDAIDKLCYLSLTDENVPLSRADYKIDIILDKEARTITVRDNGIGMTQAEAENNLGVIAKSGSYTFKGEMDAETAEGEDLSIIGQFGVGFYSAFMVSDEVTVLSRKYGEEQGVQWHSKGADGYTVTPIEKDTVGTDVIMHIKPDTEEEIYGSYLEVWKIKALVRKYSDYVRWPIKMDVEHQERYETGETDDAGNPKYEYKMVTENETINSMVPIWQRSKSEVTDDDCIQFYKEKNHGRKDPAALVRISAEGAVSYKALLFIPGDQNENAFSGDNKGGITLYANGVMIMEKCDKLVHEYFDFVKGVVDSPDLSLNISRELLQHDRQLRIIGQNLEKRIKGELEKMMRDDRPRYETFFANFGTDLKVGVCDEYGRYKDFLRDLLIFYTDQDRQVTLKEYVEGMPESQKAIYFATADTVKRAMSLPQCEEVHKRGYELIYLTSPLDEMVLEALREQDGKRFCNVVTDDLGFETEEEKKAAEERDIENKELLDFVKESVGEGVAKVRLSRKLSTQPCCLTTEGGITLEMERYFRHGPSEEARKIRATRVLELNPDHHAFTVLKEAYDNDKDKAAKLAKILSVLAEMTAGTEVEDPVGFAGLVAELF